MIKFSHELRAKVIKVRLGGKGLSMLIKEFGVGQATVGTWIDIELVERSNCYMLIDGIHLNLRKK